MATAAKAKAAPAENFGRDTETPYTIGFTVKGVKTFFFNRYDVDEFYAKDSSAPGSRKRKEHDPEKLVWRDQEGLLAVEGHQFHKSLCEAARYRKDPSGTGRRSARPFLEEAVAPVEEVCSFGVKEWDAIDVRPTRLKNGSMVPKGRPVLHPGWEATIHFDVLLPELLSPADITDLIGMAGRVRGVGDASKLGYGRFVVVNVETPQDLTWGASL